MNEHIEVVHKKIKKHVCGECEYGAFKKRELKRHIDRVHKNIRNNDTMF